jgi:hypothetical protein
MNKCIHWEEYPFNTCSVNGRDFYCVKCLWMLAENRSSFLISKSDILKHNIYSKEVENVDLNFPILVCPRTYIGYSILDGYDRFKNSKLNDIHCKIIEWTELDKLAFPKKLLNNNNNEKNEIKKQKIEKILELDIISIFEFMIEKFLKGDIHWIKGIKYMTYTHININNKEYKVNVTIYNKWIKSKTGIDSFDLYQSKLIDTQLKWSSIYINMLINMNISDDRFWKIRLLTSELNSLKSSNFSKCYKDIEKETPQNIIDDRENLIWKWIDFKENHTNLIFILLERKNNPQSPFYKHYLPMDMFKIIVKISDLAYFDE